MGPRYVTLGGLSNRCSILAGPIVRIRVPPAKSLQTVSSSAGVGFVHKAGGQNARHGSSPQLQRRTGTSARPVRSFREPHGLRPGPTYRREPLGTPFHPHQILARAREASPSSFSCSASREQPRPAASPRRRRSSTPSSTPGAARHRPHRHARDPRSGCGARSAPRATARTRPKRSEPENDRRPSRR